MKNSNLLHHLNKRRRSSISAIIKWFLHEWHRVKTNAPGARIKTTAVFLALIIMINLLILSFPSQTQASTAKLVPDGDITTTWMCNDTNPTCISAVGGTHYTRVDESDVNLNTADYISTGSSGSTGETEEYSMETIASLSSASSIMLCLNVQTATVASTADTVRLDGLIDGSYLGFDITPTASFAWYCASATGSYTQSTIDNLQMRIVRTRIGSGPLGNQDDDIRIAGVYSNVTYVKSFSFTQASYRIYDNLDSGTSPVTTFANAVGAGATDVGRSIQSTSDGGYVIAGNTSSSGAGLDDAYILKLDSTGRIAWDVLWGGTASDRLYGIVQMPDGGFAAVGETASYTAGSNDVIILRYDAWGTLIWQRIWGNTGNDMGRGIAVGSDGGVVVTGETSSYGQGAADVFLVKVNDDATGTIAWSKTWGSASSDFGYAMTVTQDGKYAVAGGTLAAGAGGGDIIFLVFNADGSLSSEMMIGGSGSDVGRGITQASDGSFAITGNTASYGTGDDIIIIKFSDATTYSWTRTWGGTTLDWGQSISSVSDGYIAAGQASSVGGPGGSDHAFIKVLFDGTFVWDKLWGGTSNDIGLGIGAASNDGFAVTGQVGSYGSGSFDVTVAKFDSSGAISGCSTTPCVDPSVTLSSQSPTVVDPNLTWANHASTQNSIPTGITDNPPFITTVVTALNSPTVNVSTSLTGSQNTAATVPSNGGPFRLRTTVRVGLSSLDTSEASFKLQYALRGADNSCDTSGTNETYADVTTTTTVRYYNNTNATGGLPLVSNANDPTDGANNPVLQNYQEAGSTIFSNYAAVPVGDYGIWDFALTTNGATFGQRYCLRILESSGTALTYIAGAIPEIIIPNSKPDAPTFSSISDSTSTLPTVAFSTVDAESDYLRYKFEICGDGTCSSILKTADQTLSQTGWEGRDAVGGTAYSAGSIARHNFQPSDLSNSLSYWVRAYAIDPGGSNLWSNPSAIAGPYTTHGNTLEAQLRGGVIINGGTVIGN